MTFIPPARIEARAAELWRGHRLQPGFDIERLLDDLGLDLLWEEIADPGDASVLGQILPARQLIVLNERHRNRLEENGGRQRRYTLGHEVGHWILHSEAARSGTLNLFDGERILCRDKSSHPVERQAEFFAAALLVPREQLQIALPKSPWRGWPTVYSLADHFVVSATSMAIRLEEVGWMHRELDGTPVSGEEVATGQQSLFR